MSKWSSNCYKWLISKNSRIYAMEFTYCHNILIVFFIILNIYHNIFVIGQFVSEVIPENYDILLNFSGHDDCSVIKCKYEGQVTITMLVTGRASFILQSDPETKIDQAKTELYRIYPNDTRVPTRITDFIYTIGDISSIIEIQVEQTFHMMSESLFDLTLYFTREFDNGNGVFGANPEAKSDTILMMTHFIPNRAHRLFPCLSDQHKYTSSFEITFIYPSIYNVITGLPSIDRREIYPGTNISIYDRTKKIPIEHLFFIIWRYDFHDAGPLAFYFPPVMDKEVFSFMAGFTIKCFKWISNITGTIAPVFPMMNIAPVSNSLIMDYYTAPGITLVKKQRVLYNHEESSTTDKLELVTAISQAVASQWIGILIYPQSRSDFWIYQALANYVANCMMHALEPTFRSTNIFLARAILWTRCDRDLDASTTLPFYLFDTWDDKMYFRRDDYMGYQAMTIISMVHEIYNFENGGTLLRQALMRWGQNEFGPSKIQMVESLQKYNVDQLVKDWSKMPGIPVIHVALDRTERRAELIQERFNPSGPWSDEEFAWTIPIRCYNSTINEFYFQWMKPNEPFWVKAVVIKDCFMTVNTFVPYRVNYPETWWMEIIAKLKKNPKDMEEMIRMRIIDDMLEFCLAGYIKLNVLFDLLSYLSNELDYFPWLAGAKALTKLRAILGTGKSTQYKSYYQQMAVKYIFNVYDYVEENIDKLPDHYLRLHRKNIVNLACSFGHEKCLRKAEDRLKCYIQEVSSDQCQNGSCHGRWKKCMRDPDEREIMLCQGLRRADINQWISILKLLNATDLFPSTRLVISRGLACTENRDILENYIYFMLHNTEMFPSDNVFPILLTAARLNELNSQVILHFIVKNHEQLVERLALPHEFHKQMLTFSQNIYFPKSNTERINLQGSPLTYKELPKDVRKILEVNTLRANRLRPMIEEYLEAHQKSIHV